MYFRLENKESQKAQEIGNLIRVYNRSKREEAESEPLNLYVEDENYCSKQKLKLRIETVILLLSILTSSRHRTFIRNMATRKFLLCKTILTQEKDFITKKICKKNMKS